MSGAGEEAVAGADRPRPLANRVGAIVLPTLGFAAALVLWWAAIKLFADPDGFLARFTPATAWEALVRLVGSGEILHHGVASIKRIGVGLCLAAAAGVPLGIALGSSRLVERVTGPLWQFVRMISPLSWTPLAIILFGIGDAPVYFLIAIGAMWPLVLNTASGIGNLDPGWILLGRSLGATRWESLRSIVWPGIRPDLVVGLRIATGLAWIIIVPAEMLGVDSGLGYFILDARDRFAYGELLASIAVIGTIGFALDGLTRGLAARH